MAATSPYTPNDYQAVGNFRPYELPINDIFKAISAQNAFWNAGAAKVKAVYDNALNLKLSLEPNKEIRKKYMEDAEKQLTKLSSMDLSDPSVQRQGFALFKPLFQDEGVMYDDLTTRHYEKVRNDALMYRSKENGKGYSDINFQYAMQGFNEFIGSKDRMAGKEFYNGRKEYTPYYDYTEDFSKALKDCKPSSIETTSPEYGKDKAMTGYMKESFSKGLSAGQVKSCLEAGLSPNASRQLQIEGAVKYKDHVDVLASDTASYLSGVTDNLSTRLQQLAATKAGIMNNKTLSASDKAKAIESIDNQLKGTTEELDRTNHSVSKINAGDFTEVQNNFDTYAGTVYSYRKLYNKALSSAFEEKRENYKADPVQLTSIRFANDKYLRQMDFSFDVSLERMKQEHASEMKLLDLMYGSTKDGAKTGGADVYRNPLTGEITVNPNLLRETPNVTGIPEQDEKVYEKITQEVSNLGQQDQNNNLRLYNNFLSRAERDVPFREALLKGFNYGTTDDEWTRFKNDSKNNKFSTATGIGGIQSTPWFQAYTAQKPTDEDVNKWSNENMLINTGLGVLNRKIEIAEKQVSKELGADYTTEIKKRTEKIQPIILQNGSTVSGEELANAISGKAGRVKLVFEGATPTLGQGISSGGALSAVEVDGVRYSAPLLGYGAGGNPEFSKIQEAYGNVAQITRDVTSKFAKKRVDVYNKLGFDREPWYFTPNDKAPLVQTLKSIMPKDSKGKEADISIVSSDFSGGVRIAIPGVKEGDDDMLDLIRRAGVGTSVEATGEGIVTIKGTNYNLVPQAIQNPILGQAAYQMASIGETTSFAQTQEGAKVQNADIDIPIMIRGVTRNMTIETYKSHDRPEYRVFIKDATLPNSQITASNPYELFEKIGRLPFELAKPVK